jgi:hypothetical protein
LSLNQSARGVKAAGEPRLDSKDKPILLAAIHGKADFLLTSDARHLA